MYTAICDALTGLGYTVHTTPQEKMGTIDVSKELVVLFDDTSVEIETTLTYHVRTWLTIEWNTRTPDSIHSSVVSMVGTLEESLLGGSSDLRATFKFIQSEVNKLGQMYRVIITVEFVEVINLG